MIKLKTIPKDKFGIYSIINTVNGKVYIGSTTSSYYDRIRRHLNQLEKGKNNASLQCDWDLYGPDVFIWRIEKILYNRDLVFSIEQDYLNFIFSVCNSEEIYNSCPTAKGTIGRKRPEHEKRKLSKIIRERMDNDAVRDRIRKSALKRLENEDYRAIVISRLSKFWLAENKIFREYNGFVSPEGIIHDRITNLTDFCKAHNLKMSSLFGIISGKNKSYRGWTYIGEKITKKTPVYKLDISLFTDIVKERKVA